MSGQIVYAVVPMFGRRKICRVTAFGVPQPEYNKDQTLWVERPEDMYAQSHYQEPYCILNRKDWINGGEL